MMHGIEFDIVVIVCGALVAGAATRFCLRGTQVPYTIALLVLGLAVGWLLRNFEPGAGGLAGGHEGGALALLASGQVLSSGLILFVFLPALVFESAFSLDTYVVKRDLGAISLLAIPAMLACTLLSSAWMMGLTHAFDWSWSWTAALVFGALISATDPVAVVALMRSVGAPKRLGTLVEGESLFNDGTAIVLFTVLLGILSGTAESVSVGATFVRFLVVVVGGIAVGLVLSLLTSAWVSRTFNDPLVEIALILVVAYAAMAIGEGLLHVSGVIAVVTVGLWMGGPGKTGISPEVGHALHKFFGFLSYCANTLIFLLVGVVIAVQMRAAATEDILVCVITFVGLILVRVLVVFVIRPLFKAVGDPVGPGQALVLSWAGLRGAVSLALALVVNQTESIPESIRHQILLVTAGIVLLTMLVNGGTTGWLLRRVGLDRAPLGVQLARMTTQASTLHEVQRQVQKRRRARVLPTAPWDQIEGELAGRLEVLQTSIDGIEAEMERGGQTRSAGYWRQALEVERNAFWSDFALGILSPRGVRILDHEVDVQLNSIEHGKLTPPPRRLVLQGLSPFGLGSLFGRPGREAGGRPSLQVQLLYELAQTEVRAAGAVLSSLKASEDELDATGAEVLAELEGTYLGYVCGGLATLEDLRTNMPEVVRAIESRLARQIGLNVERAAWEQLGERGALDETTAKRLQEGVEERMAQLQHSAPVIEQPIFRDLCRVTPLFAHLGPKSLDAIEALSEERFLAPGEVLFEQGDEAKAMFIVARGVLEMLRESGKKDMEPRLFDVLGAGAIIGEVALLTGDTCVVTVRARTGATVTSIGRAEFVRLMAEQPALEKEIWQAFAVHRLCLLADTTPGMAALDINSGQAWIAQNQPHVLADGDALDLADCDYLFLALGCLSVDGEEVSAPALLRVDSALRSSSITAKESARVRLLGPPPGIPA